MFNYNITLKHDVKSHYHAEMQYSLTKGTFSVYSKSKPFFEIVQNNIFFVVIILSGKT